MRDCLEEGEMAKVGRKGVHLEGGRGERTRKMNKRSHPASISYKLTQLQMYQVWANGMISQVPEVFLTRYMRPIISGLHFLLHNGLFQTLKGSQHLLAEEEVLSLMCANHCGYEDAYNRFRIS